MKVGDIVRLKPEHHLKEFIKGDCFITQVVSIVIDTERLDTILRMPKIA
jgi:hypothetical protein